MGVGNHRLLRYPLRYHPNSKNADQIRLNEGLSGPHFGNWGGIEGGILEVYEAKAWILFLSSRGPYLRVVLKSYGVPIMAL